MYAKLQDIIGRKDRSRLHRIVQNVNVEEVSQEGITWFYFK